MTRCLPSNALVYSSSWIKSVSEKSKVSCRNHCRSDPVRVQSTNHHRARLRWSIAVSNDHRAFYNAQCSIIKCSARKICFMKLLGWQPLASRPPPEKYCYGWLHRRLLRRYRPQSAVSCSTLWERAAGSPPNTSQVSLQILASKLVSQLQGSLCRCFFCVCMQINHVSKSKQDLFKVTPKGVQPPALCHASATRESPWASSRGHLPI